MSILKEFLKSELNNVYCNKSWDGDMIWWEYFVRLINEVNVDLLIYLSIYWYFRV